MNRKYIKRQISLYKVGIDIDENLHKYYNKINDLCDNIYRLEDEIIPKLLMLSYKSFWFKENKLVIECNHELEHIWMTSNYYNVIQELLQTKDGFNLGEKCEIIHSVLEEKLNMEKVNIIYHLDETEVKYFEEKILSDK